eukprot:TRINITY_DN12095_c3_g2_i4.p1 TRINITY_DN12095_c3_g2~~TRINITY_DN12095_c3_g2_i4.p1  ORF type:complete len:1304 (+),score=400.93 TRINITY_DN12095_c3_g2_i4:47-3958(+)
MKDDSMTVTKPVEKDKADKPKEEEPKVPFIKLFQYADRLDLTYVILGSLSALVHGALQPVFVVFFGDVIDEFGSDDSFEEAVRPSVIYMVYLAAIAFVTSYFQVAFFTLAAQRQTLRIRKRFFRALVSQDMTWFDKQNSGSLTVRISEDIPKIQQAMGDKFGAYIQFMGMFFGGFIVGFIYSWKLTLVILSIVPLMVIGGMLMGKLVGDANQAGSKFYSKAGAVADETIRMIRTVIAFDTHVHESERYKKELAVTCREGTKAGLYQGAGMGFFFGVIFLSYALTFWYGGTLVNDGEISTGEVLTAFFAVIIGAMALGQAAPNIATMAAGQAAAAPVFDVINRTPDINSLCEEGVRPTELKGRITLNKVNFTYPTRPDEQVLHDFDLTIEPKETVALVGQSGCGKSTVMQLLERFYDPSSGSVSLDGVDIKDINIQWLRSQIALVSQMPVLFPTTIYDNIALGADNVTREQVEAAAKMANAHDFIQGFPDKYETMVGDSGAQMSGGQRQRIVIARALVKSPDILLLDEATSALDNESEGKVKEALDRAAKERTTILIAHRLSTVFSADRIVVIDHGRVVETGRPQDLLDQRGRFYGMVQAQYGNGDPNQQFDLDLLKEQTSINDKSVENLDDVLKKPRSKGKGNHGTTALSADLKKNGDKEDDDEEEVPDVDRSMFKWVFGRNRPEIWYIIGGCLGACVEGGVWPAYAIVLSEILGAMNDSDFDTVNNYALGFIGIAFALFLGVALKFYLLAVAGERLTKRLREESFMAMITQPASWYDFPENSRGILTSRLSADASAVRGMMGDRLALMAQIVATLIGCLLVAFIVCWRVGAVLLAAAPIVGLGGALQFKLMSGFASGKAYERSGKFASQAIEHVRDVAALGRLEAFVDDYVATLAYPTQITKRTAHIQGATFGFSEFGMFGIWALSFWWSAVVVDDGHCSFEEVFQAQFAIVFMGMIVGQATSLAPDYAKAMAGAKRIYVLLEDYKRRMADKKTLPTPPVNGTVAFKNVDFNYPTRPDASVLQNFNLEVKPGETVALVGPSGCGKSTTISLLEEFYKPNAGHILIDGKPLDEIDSKHYRKHVSLVSQQPELFAMSIRENIAYGLEREVTDDEIIQAAKDANAHDFIMEFEEQYNTQVGEKGAQLSGGQRQRIAIARALIRAEDIKILLLDEASAALDTHSEQMVHNALEKARAGRTTLVVAHRLSTIKNADRIAVIHEGNVKELGSHDELMAKNGLYADLVNSQEFTAEDNAQPDNKDVSVEVVNLDATPQAQTPSGPPPAYDFSVDAHNLSRSASATVFKV